MSAKQRFRRRPLKKCSCLRIDGRAQKIVRCGVTDIELDGGIEPDQLHQIGIEECPLLEWRAGLERLCTQFLYWTKRLDTETDLLGEAELQQNNKETAKTKMKFSEEIHMIDS